jgi:hypothetical protein
MVQDAEGEAIRDAFDTIGVTVRNYMGGLNHPELQLANAAGSAIGGQHVEFESRITSKARSGSADEFSFPS